MWRCFLFVGQNYVSQTILLHIFKIFDFCMSYFCFDLGLLQYTEDIVVPWSEVCISGEHSDISNHFVKEPNQNLEEQKEFHLYFFN